MLFKLLVVAAVVEAIWETCKMLWQKGKLAVDLIGAVLLAILLCIAASVDFFEFIGIPLCIPYLGKVLSGLLISRGANFVHDFLKLVEGLKVKNQ